MSDIGRILIFTGLTLVMIGGVILMLGKVPGAGRLPGDIVIQKENFKLYFPITTCLLISLFLSLLFYILNRH